MNLFYIKKDVNTRLMNVPLFLDSLDKIKARSPSPQPVYDAKGIRTNTREQRTKEKLHNERINIIQELLKIDKTFKAPNDYKPPKLTKKIVLPVVCLIFGTDIYLVLIYIHTL